MCPCQNIKTETQREFSVTRAVLKPFVAGSLWFLVREGGAYAYNYRHTYFLHDNLPAEIASVFWGEKKEE